MECELFDRERTILHNLSKMPVLLLDMRDRDNVSEFLLHDLCSKYCFNLQKAAYLVDNPDFCCLRGVAGFSLDEAYPESTSVWYEADAFSDHMANSAFNNHVRRVNQCSVDAKEKTSLLKNIRAIANGLHFDDYDVCSWQLPNDNYGIVLYQKDDPTDNIIDQYLMNGLSLLSFCPLF